MPINFRGLRRTNGRVRKRVLLIQPRLKISANHPSRGEVTYRLEPLIENQEFYGNQADNAYWEGACKVMDDKGDQIGKAYLELAGYGGWAWCPLELFVIQLLPVEIVLFYFFCIFVFSCATLLNVRIYLSRNFLKF